MVQIGINRHLLAGHRVEGKACGHFGNALGTLCNDDKVHNNENNEHDKADDGITADDKVSERSNNLTGIAVEEDKSCRRDIQRQSKERRNQK